jgi:hypothetical protein
MKSVNGICLIDSAVLLGAAILGALIKDYKEMIMVPVLFLFGF